MSDIICNQSLESQPFNQKKIKSIDEVFKAASKVLASGLKENHFLSLKSKITYDRKRKLDYNHIFSLIMI